MATVASLALRTKQFIEANRGQAIVIGIVAILVLLIVPLPPFALDFFLIINIVISVTLLALTAQIKKPLDLAVFPSLLLITTLYRLSLNVSATKLILGNPPSDGSGAGKVIQTFGEFVGRSDPIVGFIIFIILVIIQFVVITKGATRIAEVAARFTLDAMPGKQFGIDADLNAGLINEQQARARRENLEREANFYGAMDGASKFVRGDAIAGIVITAVNLLGGIIIGPVRHDITILEALRTYSIMTIGDGLVTQIPAFLISIAAGLIVTRSTDRSNLGEEVIKQITGQPKSLIVASFFLGVMLLTPLPKIPLIIIGVSALLMYRLIAKRMTQEADIKVKKEAKEAKEAQVQPEKVKSLLKVEPLELEIGYGLVKMVDKEQGGELLERIKQIRKQCAFDPGLVVPPIRIRDNMQLEPNQYVVKIRGIKTAEGTAMPGQWLTMDSGVATSPIQGIETREPAFNLPAVWIVEAQRHRAELLGYTVVDATTVVATHLQEVIKGKASELLTRTATQALLDNLKETHAPLIEEVLKASKLGVIQKVLQNLLRERVNIRNLEGIIEVICDYGERTQDPDILSEFVRGQALPRVLSQQHQSDDGKIYCVSLDPNVENLIANAIENTPRGTQFTMPPRVTNRVTDAMVQELEKLLRDGKPGVILCSPTIRSHVKRMMDTRLPGISVLSYNEISQEINLESVGVVTVQL